MKTIKNIFILLGTVILFVIFGLTFYSLGIWLFNPPNFAMAIVSGIVVFTLTWVSILLLIAIKIMIVKLYYLIKDTYGYDDTRADS